MPMCGFDISIVLFIYTGQSSNNNRSLFLFKQCEAYSIWYTSTLY